MRNASRSKPVEVHVLFRSRDADGGSPKYQPGWLEWWRDRWCDPAFWHVVVARRHPTGPWAVMDYRLGALAVDAYKHETTIDDIQNGYFCDTGRITVEVCPDYSTFRWPGVLSCVSLAKAVLGLRGWRAWLVTTPRQLHDHMEQVYHLEEV